MILFLGVLLWLGFGLASWCVYQGAYKNKCYAWLPPDNIEAGLFALFGPINFIATAMTFGIKRWSFFPITREERWELWKRKGYGDSPEDREVFEAYK